MKRILHQIYLTFILYYYWLNIQERSKPPKNAFLHHLKHLRKVYIGSNGGKKRTVRTNRDHNKKAKIQ